MDAVPTIALLLLALQAPTGSSEETAYVEPSVAAAVSRARPAVLKKLGTAKCRGILAEFKDLEGVPLEEVLIALGETPEIRIRKMAFLDGSRMYPCRQRDVYAFTNPGLLSVFLCDRFRKLVYVNVDAAANILIHEMLHSIGTGEAPTPGFPDAYEISSRVDARCAR